MDFTSYVLRIKGCLLSIEKKKTPLEGALSDNNFSRLGLDFCKFASLISYIVSIHTLKDNEQLF
jgi:hypothetical protein